MIGSQFVAYLNPNTREVVGRPAPTALERHIAGALRIRTNTIAGRPNAGNLALEFTHRGRPLPATVARDYLLRTLKAFVPDVAFEVDVQDGLDADGFQPFTVTYRAP